MMMLWWGVKLEDSCPTVYDAAICTKQNYPTSISVTPSYFTGMSEERHDEAINDELMRCFSNVPSTVQAIQVLRAMQLRPEKIARLYTARYEIIHYRMNQLTADEQIQNGRMMFYAGTLHEPLRKSYSRRYIQTIGQEPWDKHLTSYWNLRRNIKLLSHNLISLSWRLVTRILKVSTSSQWKKYRLDHRLINKVNISKVTSHSFRSSSTRNQTMVRDLTREVNSRLTTTRATNFSTNRDPNLINAADPSKTMDIKVKVSQGQGMQQPRIDFGMVLPTQWGLEQFLEMTKALNQIEDKYTNPQPYNSQQRQNNASTSAVTSQDKKNQNPDESIQMTSWHSQITKSI